MLGFEAESEDADVEADSDDPDFDEESVAAGLLSPLFSVAARSFGFGRIGVGGTAAAFGA